jgi:hypothetical protein
MLHHIPLCVERESRIATRALLPFAVLESKLIALMTIDARISKRDEVWRQIDAARQAQCFNANLNAAISAVARRGSRRGF